MFGAVKFETIDRLIGDTQYQPPWLIDAMVTQGSFVVVAGEAGIGKSTLFYSLSMCVAAGVPFLGRPVTPAHVLYCDEENSAPDYLGYWQQIWHGLGCPDRGLLEQRLHFASFQLGSGWLPSLQDAVKGFPDTLPLLLVIDTTTPALNVQDEDKNAEATQAIQGLRSLQAQRNVTIIALKHARIVEGESGADRYIIRGAKAWLGGTDATWFLTFAPGRPPANPLDRGRVITPRKIRAFGLQKTINLCATYETVAGHKTLKIIEKL